MLGKVFGVICILSFVGAMITGDPAALGNAVLDGASDAITLTLTLCGMMGLWCGIMRVLESAGLIRCLARMMRPLLRFFFPAASEDEEACGAIAANISANLLGLGNAATPFALRAMERLQRQNPEPGAATPDMITLAVLNTASVSLIPTTLLAMRRAAGSSDPYRVIPVIWITSFSCAAFALFLCRAMGSACRRTAKTKGSASPVASGSKRSNQASVRRRT